MALGNNLNTERKTTEKPNKEIDSTRVNNPKPYWESILFNSMIVVVTDTIGIIEVASDEFCNLSGYHSEELVGQPFSTILHQDHASFSPNHLGKQEAYKKELRHKRKDGSTLWLETNIHQIDDYNGSGKKNICLFTDITKIKLDAFKLKDLESAIDTGWARIEFKPDGTILSANRQFANTLGYESEDQIIGNHHRIFVSPDYSLSTEYQLFWRRLAEGVVNSGEFKRITKDGREVWINASYTPVKNDIGEVIIVIKIASDITSMVEDRSRAKAIKSAVDTGWGSIEFESDGTIISANTNFLHMMGYNDQSEIKGKHHKIFVDTEYASSSDYQMFWTRLGSGNLHTGEFKRVTKDGKDVWINASYTPILDENGDTKRVIKIATGITSMIEKRIQADAVKSAVDAGWASIEFDTNGNILTANKNFVVTMGYASEEEIIGRHHSIFVDQQFANSIDYQDFWKNLSTGLIESGEFKRRKKSGDDVWINASYTPVRDDKGEVFKIIKIANDITEQKSVIKAIQHAIKKAGEEGDMSARVEINYAQGDYKTLADSVNKLIEAISSPIEKMKKLVIELSNGVLDNSFDITAAGDIKEMGDAYNLAVSNLNELMYNITELANLVAASSEEMLTKGEQMKGSTFEMSSAIQQMSEGVQDQAQQIDGVSKIMDQLLASAKQVAENSIVINKKAEEGKNSSQSGMTTVNAVVERMSEIQESAEITSNSIHILTQRSEEIARTLNVITDIASQTNLLALNATIEAARAGDAGRGFAVVAQEIRKLAEDSRQSAQNIERVIREVQKDIGAADKAIHEMEASVKIGNKASFEAEEVFKIIDTSSQQTFELSNQISTGARHQEASLDDAGQKVERIVVVSEETASGTEQIATSAKELSQGMDEVSATSRDLADVANQLLLGISKFKLNQ